MWRQSSPHIKSLFNSTRDAIFIVKDLLLVDCNDATLEMFGGSYDEIIGTSLFEFFPDRQPNGVDSREISVDLIKSVLNGNPQFFEWEHKRLDGTTFMSDVLVSKITIGDEELVQGMIRDRTLSDKVADENKKLAMLANITTNMVIMSEWRGEDRMGKQCIYENHRLYP